MGLTTWKCDIMKAKAKPRSPAQGLPEQNRLGKAATAGRGLAQALASVRPSMLPYMLIFSLAPIFPNFKNSMAAYTGRVMNLDGMFVMGIAFSLGIGLMSLVARPGLLARVARVLSVITMALFLGWIFIPLPSVSSWLELLFGLGLGGCAGIALFGFTYALNDMERLFGATVTVLFCIASQMLLSVPILKPLGGPIYLGAQVLVTMLCFLRFNPEAYAEKLVVPKEKNNKVLAVALYFFLAHRAVVFFFSYLPRTHYPVWNGLAGVALLLICLYIFFAFRFNTWYMCGFFFVGMLTGAVLQLLLHNTGSSVVFDALQGFGYMGYIASYYLLGYVLSRHVDYKRFRLIILVIFNSSLLLHIIPGTFSRYAPDAMLSAGAVLTLVLFVVFAMLAPVFSQKFFPIEADKPGDSSLRLMQEKGLTAREQEITRLLLQGKLIKECAYTLGISEHTVKFHAKNIYRKLEINGRSELLSAFTDLIP